MIAAPASAAAPQPLQEPSVFASQSGTLAVLMVAAKRPSVAVSPNNSSDRPKSAQATKHLGQRFHCRKLHQTVHSHSCER